MGIRKIDWLVFRLPEATVRGVQPHHRSPQGAIEWPVATPPDHNNQLFSTTLKGSIKFHAFSVSINRGTCDPGAMPTAI
jgi:hypothetical protein